MAVSVLTVRDLTPEDMFSQAQYLTQSRYLQSNEAGKAIVAHGSKWIKTKRNQVPTVVTELPTFDLNTY